MLKRYLNIEQFCRLCRSDDKKHLKVINNFVRNCFFNVTNMEVNFSFNLIVKLIEMIDIYSI